MVLLESEVMREEPYQDKIVRSHVWQGTIWLFLMVLFVIFPLSGAKGRESFVSTECELKTAFIYQFTKYVSWPKDKREKNRLVIGVIADGDMLDAISQLDGKLSQGMKISVVPLEDPKKLDGIDILYVERGYKIEKNIVSQAVKHHILTISDDSDATKKGIIIALYMANSRLRFNVNLKVANASNLKLSSRLLRLANKLVQ